MAMQVTDRPMLNRVRHALEFFGFGGRIAPFPIRRQARPWTLAEVPQAPAGWAPAPPDYVGVGTQKSGTSWWASLIESHPDVVPNRFGRKEMHYLTHFFDRPLTTEDRAAYHAAFARPAGKRCGEWTPNYLASPYTLVRLLEAAPAARVLVMLRNPVSRFDSGFNHEFRNRYGAMIVPGVRRAVITRYALRKESIWMGMYGAQLAAALSIVPRAQMLVLQYERCKRDAAAMLEATYRFLGLDPSFRPAEIDRPVNTQKRVVDPLSSEARRMLTEIYRDDVQRLATLFPEEIDLALWPEFGPAGAGVGRLPRRGATGSEPSASDGQASDAERATAIAAGVALTASAAVVTTAGS